MSRKKRKNPRKGFYRFATSLFRVYFSWLYNLKVYGTEHLFEGGAIIVANHTSFYDPPLISAILPEQVHFLAKESLFRIPVLSWVIRKLSAHPIRGSVRDLGVFRLVARLIKEEKKVVLFPEGTRAVSDRVTPLKRGVALMISRSRAPVIPIYIEGAEQVYGRKHKFPKFKGRLRCAIGASIHWENFEHLPEKEAQGALLEAISTSLSELRSYLADGAQGNCP